VTDVSPGACPFVYVRSAAERHRGLGGRRVPDSLAQACWRARRRDCVRACLKLLCLLCVPSPSGRRGAATADADASCICSAYSTGIFPEGAHSLLFGPRRRLHVPTDCAMFASLCCCAVAFGQGTQWLWTSTLRSACCARRASCTRRRRWTRSSSTSCRGCSRPSCAGARLLLSAALDCTFWSLPLHAYM
jgi:hypothetical protein